MTEGGHRAAGHPGLESFEEGNRVSALLPLAFDEVAWRGLKRRARWAIALALGPVTGSAVIQQDLMAMLGHVVIGHPRFVDFADIGIIGADGRLGGSAAE